MSSGLSSGLTWAVKQILVPSGDQTGFDAPLRIFVNWKASPPSVGITQICRSPLRSDTKASLLPSGDHLGLLSVLGPDVNCLGLVLPQVDVIQICERYSLAFSSIIVLTYAIRFPSGETCGSDTNTSLYKSSGVSLLLVDKTEYLLYPEPK